MSAPASFVLGVVTGWCLLLGAFAVFVFVMKRHDEQASIPRCTCHTSDTIHAASCDLVELWAKERNVPRGNGPIDLAGTVYQYGSR